MFDRGRGRGVGASARDGLVSVQLQRWKATTTLSRNRDKFCVPDEIRKIAADAAKCRKPCDEENTCARSPVMHGGRFEARRAVLPRGEGDQQTCCHKSLVQYVVPMTTETNGQKTVRAHCERCCDDKEANS